MGTRDTKGAGRTAIPRGKAEGGEWKNAAVRALHEALTERVRRHSQEPGWDPCTGLSSPVPNGWRAVPGMSLCGMTVPRGWGAQGDPPHGAVIPSGMGSLALQGPPGSREAGTELSVCTAPAGMDRLFRSQRNSLAAPVLLGKSGPTYAGN